MLKSLRAPSLLAGALLAALSAPAAFAWNYEGHLIVGEIAWQKLDAADKAALAKLLKAHPNYANYLTTGDGTDAAPQSEKDELAFVKAATWPDAVRPARAPYRPLIIDPTDEKNVTQYNHASWHYIDIAFVLPSDTKDAALQGKGLDTAGGDVVTTIRKSASGIASKEDDPQKAIDLAWIEHTIGDIHQPLHATTLISDQFPPPGGDHGGNSITISFLPTSSPAAGTDAGADAGSGRRVVENLHSFWDGAVGTLDMEKFSVASLPDLRKRAADFMAAHPETAESALMTKDATPESWAEESYDYAKKDVYLNGAIFNLPKPGPGYELPAGYVTRSHALAEERVTLAGYRLAATLHTALAAATGTEVLPKP